MDAKVVVNPPTKPMRLIDLEQKEKIMYDFSFLAVIVLFFALSWLYVKGLVKL